MLIINVQGQICDAHVELNKLQLSIFMNEWSAD